MGTHGGSSPNEKNILLYTSMVSLSLPPFPPPPPHPFPQRYKHTHTNKHTGTPYNSSCAGGERESRASGRFLLAAYFFKLSTLTPKP
jgi:hypothetical protein